MNPLQKQVKQPEILKNEDEWFSFRLGRITGSEVWKLMKNGRSNGDLFSQTGKTYLLQKVGEIICGQNERIENVKALEWGKRWEPECAKVLMERGFDFNYYGGNEYMFFPFNRFSGSSLDGLSDTHVYEMKCPYSKENHVENLLISLDEDPIKSLEQNRFEYLMQMYFEMICAGRQKGFFVSFDPRPVDPALRLAIIEVTLDENWMKEMEMRVNIGGAFIRDKLKELKKIPGQGSSDSK